MESIVRVLVSFFLATDENSSARNTMQIHKEKFNVPLSEDHKKLFKFKKHLKTFTGLDDNARSKGLGENPEDSAHAYKKTHLAFLSGSIVLRYEELIVFFSSLTTRVKSK